MRRTLSVFALPLVLALAGCKSSSPAAPDEAYLQFAQATRSAHEGKGGKELLDYFDASTRTELVARAKAASQQTGNTMPEDAAYQLLLGGPQVAPIAQVQVVESSGDTARLRVVTDGGEGGEVKMVREDGRWRVHLELGARP